MDDQGDSAPAQWAADPSGRHRYRYWDGTRWTGHVYDGADAPLAPPREVPRDAPREAAPRRPERPTRMVVEPTDEDPTDLPRDRRAAGSTVVLDGRRGRRCGRRGHCPDRVGGARWRRREHDDRHDAAASDHHDRGDHLDDESLVTTTTLAPGRPPAQVRVQVLNGSGTAGAASTKATALKTAGYTIAGTGNARRARGRWCSATPASSRKPQR